MNNRKKISIIGSTGSIGTQALEVIEKLQDKETGLYPQQPGDRPAEMGNIRSDRHWLS